MPKRVTSSAAYTRRRRKAELMARTKTVTAFRRPVLSATAPLLIRKTVRLFHLVRERPRERVIRTLLSKERTSRE